MNGPAVISSLEEARDLIQHGAAILSDAKVHRPQWTAEQLLAERLGCLPVDLYVQPPRVTEEVSVRYRADIAARAGGVPLQYLLGSAEFYGRRFAVGPGVFNPRPETEILVETVLELIPVRGEPFGSAVHPELVEGERPAQDRLVEARLGIADVGTGSGAIAVTLAAERPDLEVAAVDRSEVALHFARRNAHVHGCPVRFLQGDLLEGFGPGSLDGVVSNPPYLDPGRAGEWPKELSWEPWLALNGGEKGLESIERLASQARVVLRPGGWLSLEIGMEQGEAVRGIAARHGFCVEKIQKDLAGLDRVAVLKREE